ncbi:MAG: ribosome biogenesis/translation initiation ATPase RLI [Candidatus Pacearchaeota archaeon]
MKRLAIIKKEECHPQQCQELCKRLCPINRKGEDCIKIIGKASISEELCIGCGICQNRCPFEAISIVNLPEELTKKLVYRYGKNGFALYSLPIPRFGSVLGFLGKNGIGKSTALDILSNKLTPNFGMEKASVIDIKTFFKGSELLSYFENLPNRKIAIKPQNISVLAKSEFKVIEFLKKFAKISEINILAEELYISNILEKKLNELSGGELQKVAILAATLKKADIYFLDEPLAYLDISERIRVSNHISKLSEKNKSIVLIEHDLLLLDYVTDYINIIYGKPGCYGIVSDIRTSKKAINTYLSGFLREENIRFRDKAITFNFGAKRKEESFILFEWPEFTKNYPGFCLKVNAGSINTKSIVGIVGRNAVGKTTFIKCLAGLLETEEKNLNLKLKISYKPQYLEGIGTETIATIVEKEKINKRLISLLSLEQLMSRQINHLSGGELQRLAIAICLAKEADIYLLDEPSAYLDVEERLQAARAIEETIKEKERAAFVVDHDLLFLAYIADSLIVFSGELSKKGEASKPYPIVEGMNELLKMLNITLRRDEETGRPRINKPGSVLDREQRKKGNWFEI